PPSLPGNASRLLLRSLPEGKLRRGRGCRKTETTSAAARLSSAAELGRPAYRFGPRVRRNLSATSGNPAFVLRQRSQESLLLPRLRPGRRSHSLCPVVQPSVLPPKPRPPGATDHCYRRLCRCRTPTDSRFLSTATGSLPGSDALSQP